jgi:hypothetical protein
MKEKIIEKKVKKKILTNLGDEIEKKTRVWIQ